VTAVLCLGEPLISLTPPDNTSLGSAGDVHLGVGGAELNVALHLARLGVDVAYAGAVGRDPFGIRLRAVLSEAGVDCAELREGPGPTGVYFKEPGSPTRMLYYRAGSAGSDLQPMHDSAMARFGLVHVTGVTFGLQGDIARTADLLCARPRSWRLSFDVNFRPALWSAEEAGSVLLQAAQSADVVFVGRDEAEAVWGTGDREQIQRLVGGEIEVVIKDGPHDVEVWADGEWWRSTPPPITVVDPIGAGDAFAAAYLAARLRGCDPVASAEQGHHLAGQVMGRVGDQ
jgi:2-dehydro-3-deoxygluconokinase